MRCDLIRPVSVLILWVTLDLIEKETTILNCFAHLSPISPSFSLFAFQQLSTDPASGLCRTRDCHREHLTAAGTPGQGLRGVGGRDDWHA